VTQPSVNITELDGALGVLPPSSGRLLAFVGPSSAGPTDTPATYARISDLVAAFGVGPLVEAAAHAIERYGRPVVVVRTGDTVAGAATAVTFTGTGTSVVTVDGTVEPRDDFEVLFEVLLGGTIATGPITLRYSLDGGRTWSAPIALGTANTYTVPGGYGVKVNFAAGTLVAGDTFSSRTTAGQWNAAELGDALDALAASAISWELVSILGITDADAFDAIDLALAGMAASGKYHAAIAHTRTPNLAESEATYLSALTTIFSAKASSYLSLCAGACELTSSVSGRKYRRPISFVTAPREASVSEEINIADVNLGSLSGVSIRDANGNPKHHDESVNPGLDDARFVTLRTWDDDIQGVYVNRPLLFSASGSDFQIMPHRRVLNIAAAVLRVYFIRRLNKPVLVDKDTGFILESEALAIEAGARAVLRAALLARPKASDVQFTLSRTDNLLSTKTLNGDARVVPLGYPETIELELGFLNPALQVQAA